MPFVEKQICNFQREILRNNLSAITKNNDGQIVIGKALNCGAKSDCFAIVPHAAVAFIRI